MRNTSTPLGLRLKLYARRMSGRLEKLLLSAEPLTDKDIHLLRTTCKRLRALWLLAAPLLKPKPWRRADRNLRDAGRAFAGTRDTHVLMGWTERFKRSSRKTEIKRAFDDLGNEIIPPGEEGDKPASYDASLRKKIAAQFAEDIAQWGRRVPDETTDRTIFRGHAATYAKARRLAKKALKSQDSESFHEWRKYVKYLFYQREAMAKVMRQRQTREERHFKELGSVLGALNDLHNLEGFVPADQEDVEKLVSKPIRTRNHQLRNRAARLQHTLFERKPKLFATHAASRFHVEL